MDMGRVRRMDHSGGGWGAGGQRESGRLAAVARGARVSGRASSGPGRAARRRGGAVGADGGAEVRILRGDRRRETGDGARAGQTKCAVRRVE